MAQILTKITCLILAIVLHELSHGLMAYAFGDDTARRSGRLSLNPIKHIDALGLALPVLLFMTNAPFLIGWAKPVPVDFRNLRPQIFGTFCVALAGPVMNVMLALVAGIFWKVGVLSKDTALAAININVILAAFNLLPLLPLDGGRMVTCFLRQDHPALLFFERFGLIFIVAGFMLLGPQVHALIMAIAQVILGFLDKLI